MVRSLLHSSLLRRSSGLRFALMLFGVTILLMSAPLWLGMADFDYHFSYDRQLDDLSFQQKTETSPYRQLVGENKRVVDAALNGRSFSFEDETQDFPGIVRKDGVYHKFDSRRAIDWTYPGTAGPMAVGLVGFWLVVEAVQHERKHLGTRGY